MNLHALRDRKNDPNRRLESHHALDIYLIVSTLTREEYDPVSGLIAEQGRSEAVVTKASVVSEAFCNLDGIGPLRFRQGAAEAGMHWESVRAEQFVAVCWVSFSAGSSLVKDANLERIESRMNQR